MKKFSEEHRMSLSKSLKARWAAGDFDSAEMRETWRKTALSGIAKKGRIGKRFVPSQEMLDDYSKIGDKELSSKYGVSRRLVIKLRKDYKLPKFNNQHGTKEHKFDDGMEYKWCQKGHWELVSNFGSNKSRWDGLRGWCRDCEKEKNQEYYDKNDGAKKVRDWLKTETGRSSRSATMRKVWEKRRGCYIKFDLGDEEKIYKIFDGCCAYCRSPVNFGSVEFDHFIPVKLGGKTHPSNMLPTCKSCNRSKRDKLPHYWLIKKFGEIFGVEIFQKCVSILESIGD